jgi:uncharacterized membrane protein YeaQ/YmgE (transglycosylase-associated protein family)
VVADVTFWSVVWYVVAGIVIGFIARAILPGKQQMSLLWTMILGVVAALVGGFLWNAIFPNNDGIAWIGSIIVAVVILFLYERFVAGRGAATRS